MYLCLLSNLPTLGAHNHCILQYSHINFFFTALFVIGNPSPASVTGLHMDVKVNVIVKQVTTYVLLGS